MAGYRFEARNHLPEDVNRPAIAKLGPSVPQCCGRQSSVAGHLATMRFDESPAQSLFDGFELRLSQ